MLSHNFYSEGAFFMALCQLLLSSLVVSQCLQTNIKTSSNCGNLLATKATPRRFLCSTFFVNSDSQSQQPPGTICQPVWEYTSFPSSPGCITSFMADSSWTMWALSPLLNKLQSRMINPPLTLEACERFRASWKIFTWGSGTVNVCNSYKLCPAPGPLNHHTPPTHSLTYSLTHALFPILCCVRDFITNNTFHVKMRIQTTCELLINGPFIWCLNGLNRYKQTLNSCWLIDCCIHEFIHERTSGEIHRSRTFLWRRKNNKANFFNQRV